MKKGLWLIFKCQNCISTHNCKPGMYGCAKLIGCQIWSDQKKAALVGEEANDD